MTASPEGATACSGTRTCHLEPARKPTRRPAAARQPAPTASPRGGESALHATTPTATSPTPSTAAAPSPGHHPPRSIGGGLIRANHRLRQAGVVTPVVTPSRRRVPPPTP